MLLLGQELHVLRAVLSPGAERHDMIHLVSGRRPRQALLTQKGIHLRTGSLRARVGSTERQGQATGQGKNQDKQSHVFPTPTSYPIASQGG